jgi:hypothetical protein
MEGVRQESAACLSGVAEGLTRPMWFRMAVRAAGRDADRWVGCCE